MRVAFVWVQGMLDPARIFVTDGEMAECALLSHGAPRPETTLLEAIEDGDHEEVFEVEGSVPLLDIEGVDAFSVCGVNF